MTEFDITIAQPEDAVSLLPMVRALAAFHGDVPEVTEQDLHRDLSDGWLYGLVARCENRPLGYALLTPQAQAQYGARGMDLHHLYVEQNQRGHGVGSALIASAEALTVARGGSYLIIGAEAGNIAAQRFYLSHGYETRASSGQRFRKNLP
ncbi:GNAT family N-acetyltransferase [uncultured Litoreibacter sp.]|uniref:GNAT family N-acetyltransferase n=1 Tax=uncultured Litoreibacter sp. TaxID=1392394 RepID=UPI0026399821|nr:GNAT family N-acetyltransferase [uncultured Litoreibacter sp.]